MVLSVGLIIAVPIVVVPHILQLFVAKNLEGTKVKSKRKIRKEKKIKREAKRLQILLIKEFPV